MEQRGVPSADLLRRLLKRMQGDVDKAETAICEQLVSGALRATGISNSEPWDRRAIDLAFWSPLRSRFPLQRDFNAARAQRATGRRGPGAFAGYSEIEFLEEDLVRIWSWFGPAATKAGRPAEHDWEGARFIANSYVTKHGLPPTQARLVEVVREWFERDSGKAPDEKHIRSKVARPLYQSARLTK